MRMLSSIPVRIAPVSNPPAGAALRLVAGWGERSRLLGEPPAPRVAARGGGVVAVAHREEGAAAQEVDPPRAVAHREDGVGLLAEEFDPRIADEPADEAVAGDDLARGQAGGGVGEGEGEQARRRL